MHDKEFYEMRQKYIDEYKSLISTLNSLEGSLDDIMNRWGDITLFNELQNDRYNTQAKIQALIPYGIEYHPITRRFMDRQVIPQLFGFLEIPLDVVFSPCVEMRKTDSHFHVALETKVDIYQPVVSPYADIRYRDIEWGDTIAIRYGDRFSVAGWRNANMKVVYVSDLDTLYYEVINVRG